MGFPFERHDFVWRSGEWGVVKQVRTDSVEVVVFASSPPSTVGGHREWAKSEITEVIPAQWAMMTLGNSPHKKLVKHVNRAQVDNLMQRLDKTATRLEAVAQDVQDIRVSLREMR